MNHQPRRRLTATAATVVLGISISTGCGSGDGASASSTDADMTDADMTDTAAVDTSSVDDGLVIAIGSEPTTLDPHIADDGGERSVNDNVYETLTRREPDGTLVPGLAASMPEQIDEVTWRVELRDGVAFHDGSRFDADDVVATIERVIDLGAASDQYGSFYSTLAGATAIDGLTVEITTSGPDPVLPSRLYWMKIVGDGAPSRPGYETSPVGTGPYRFLEWNRGEHVVLEANPEYWGTAPSIDRVEFVFAPEYGSRLAGLLGNDYDLITNLTPEDVDRVDRAVAVAGLEHPVITLDVDGDVTGDRRVRRALNLAVDKSALAEALFRGYAEVDRGQAMSETHFGFNDALEPYPYDPDRARALLAEAGATGATIELVGTSGRWLRDAETVEAIAGFWEEVGLVVDVRILEFGAWLDAWSDRDVRPDAVYLNSSNELFDADRTLSALFHPDGIGSSNHDRELGRLIDEARTETDVNARDQLYHTAFERAYDGAYHVYLLRVEDSYGLSERLVWEPRVDAKLIVAEMALAE